MKKIVIIPDSFKGTISSQEAGRIIEEEAKKRWPDVETVRMEIADGGEGSVDAFLSVLDMDFSLFRPLEFFVDPKNGDGRNNNPPAMRVRVDCYTKKLPFRVQ